MEKEVPKISNNKVKFIKNNEGVIFYSKACNQSICFYEKNKCLQTFRLDSADPTVVLKELLSRIPSIEYYSIKSLENKDFYIASDDCKYNSDPQVLPDVATHVEEALGRNNKPLIQVTPTTIYYPSRIRSKNERVY